jgi:hypothetical protein
MCAPQNLIVESLRSIAEIVIWGDQVRPVDHVGRFTLPLHTVVCPSARCRLS